MTSEKGCSLYLGPPHPVGGTQGGFRYMQILPLMPEAQRGNKATGIP